MNKEECTNIVKASLNSLGKLGSKQWFEEESFNKAYKKVDFMGAQKNLKVVVIGLVTSLSKPTDK